MQQFNDIASLRETLQHARRQGRRIALVPTMGNLHEGHLTLIAAARAEADLVVASIFVNPTQFGPGEDFDRYPRTLEEDCLKLMSAGCDVVFSPTPATMYPHGTKHLSHVHVPAVSEGLCGARRPGHFDGVSTVVSLLLHIVQPDIACFGEKDYQQLAVIRKMVMDLHMPVTIVGVPIVREPSGLALSSRNQYLTADERKVAPGLAAVLRDVKRTLENGGDISTAIDQGQQALVTRGFRPDYLELREAITLTPVTDSTHNAVLLVAAYLGQTRLLDNTAVTLS
ncbi:pantoate--beta-alanine ligase [Larsenimonas rhizosphaerae]|uniref:pantoate--beta-alanine ligase n=1 Tax=Larsenimonas rhizosphaerae TaxID=2944682 RepID=UPI0020338065|nr:pantoate--beta-alanine ligase [Larsenimonas rhizosphaerae]MCM2131575.1 pantoate--beta-alanine ligase [Larsenimonas rhizosphaerae]